MTHDEIIKLAREAGLRVGTNMSGVQLVGGKSQDELLMHLTVDELCEFARLVEIAAQANERRTALLKAAQMTRDACEYTDWNENGRALAEQIEAAMADQVTHGLGIMLDGKRIDQASIYKQAEPVNLQDIEQYQLQMAGICTAALGYWTEDNSIHPDYDTPALRDVVKLYAKYAALYAAQSQRKPLTDEEIKSMWGITEYREFAIDFARAIELAHGIGDA